MSEHEEPSTSIPGLSHGQLSYLQIPARDVAASRTFYARLFGWQVIENDFEAPSLLGQW